MSGVCEQTKRATKAVSRFRFFLRSPPMATNYLGSELNLLAAGEGERKERF